MPTRPQPPPQAATPRHLYASEWRALDTRAHPTDASLLVLSAAESGRLASREGRNDVLRGGDGSVGIAALAALRAPAAALPLGALELALALVRARMVAAPAMALWLLTTGTRASRPEDAGSWGLARSARTEESLPLWCIDASVAAVSARIPPPPEPEAALHRGALLVPRLASAAHVAEGSVSSMSGAHAVTGGTGGLGLLTARWLAQNGALVLAVASRSGALARSAAGEWSHLQATGAMTLVQRCDAGEATHVRRLAASGRGLCGVWHAAGGRTAC